MLEAVRQGDQPGVAIGQPQNARSEAILGVAHIRRVKNSKPLVLQLLEIIIGLRSELFKVDTLSNTDQSDR